MSGSGISILEVQPQDLDLAAVRERMAKHQDRVDELLRRYPVARAALLQCLWLIQEEFGWIPRVAIKWAAEVCQVAPVHAFAVTEFYTMYKQIPPARWHIRICQNVSCHAQGAEALIAHVEERLGIKAGEHTEDGLFAIERVECLAACGNGPAVQINDEFLFGPGDELNKHEEGWHPQAADLDRMIDKLRALSESDPTAHEEDQLGGILVGTGGHPGAIGAASTVNAADYAPPPPALGVSATVAEGAVTVIGMAAPECTKVVLERSGDDVSWQEVDACDPREIKGPPGPKKVELHDRLESGVHMRYRLLAHTGERIARPSAVVAVSTDPGAEVATVGEDDA